MGTDPGSASTEASTTAPSAAEAPSTTTTAASAPEAQSPGAAAAPQTTTAAPSEPAQPADSAVAPDTSLAAEFAAVREFLASVRQPAPTPPTAAAPPPPAQAQAQAQPSAGFFSPEDAQALKTELGDPAFAVVEKGLNSLKQQVLQALAPLDQLHADYQSRQRSMYSAAAKTMNGYFDGLGSKGFMAVYGPSMEKATDAQKQARFQVSMDANELRSQYAAKGRELSWDKAVALAHGANYSDPAGIPVTQPQAVQAVQNAVVSRSKQISIPPGTRGTSGGTANAEDPHKAAIGLWRDALRS